MGTSKDPRGGRYQAIARMDPRVITANLRDIGASADDSSYTQAGPRPGIPEAAQSSSMTLRASGSQTARGELELLTARAGHPTPNGGGYLVRDVTAGDGTTEWLGQDGYQVVTGWTSIRYDASGSGPSQRPAILRLQSGDILLAEISAVVTHTIHRYDVNAGTWSTVETMTLNPGTSDDTPTPALLQLPSGRVLYAYVDRAGVQVHVRYSDDDGDTWADYAEAVLADSAGSPIFELAMVYTRGRVMLFTVESDSSPPTTTGQQWVSHDLACTFEPVGGDWFASTNPQERPAHVSLVTLPSGLVQMIYWHDDGPAYSCRNIDPVAPGYLTERIDHPTTAPAYAQASICHWADEDGVLYCLLELGTTTNARTQLMMSVDGGASIVQQKCPSLQLAPSSGIERPLRYAATSSGGRAVWAMRWTSSGSTSGPSLAVAMLGGHSRATVGTCDDRSREFDARSYLGWGREQSGDRRWGGAWLAITDPTNTGWTATTSGTSTGAIVSPHRWQINTGVGTRYYTATDAASQDTIGACTVSALVTVVSGGSLTTDDVVLRVRISDYDLGTTTNATAINEVLIRFTTTGFRIIDAISGSQIGSDVTFAMTQPRLITVVMRAANGGNGEVTVFYGDPDGPRREMTAAITSAAFADDSGTNPTNPSRIIWGHVASSTAISQWELVGWHFWTSDFAPNQASNFVSSWDNPSDVRPRDYSALPCLVLDGVRVQALDGPTRLSERWTIATAYDYPVAALDPRQQPSPRRSWRSDADDQVERFVWDLDGSLSSTTYLENHAIVVALFRCNFKTCRLLGWNGSSWDVLANLDAADGFGSLAWTREGRMVRPDNSATSTGERYLWRHDHAGDVFDLNTGETPLHRIETNTEGAWRTDSSGNAKVKQPTVLLDATNLDGGTSTSGTGGEIWCRDFGAVVREYTGTYARLAVEIQAQKTPDGYYEIGSLFVGALLPFSRQYDRGWIRTREARVEVDERADGQRRSRVLGPERRAVEVAWVDTYVQGWAEMADDPDPDWISSGNNDLPVASRGDVVRALEGLLGQTDGDAEPVLFLPRVPQQPDGNTDPLLLTGRRRMLYGRVGRTTRRETPFARSGEEVDEVERLNAITIQEEI